MTQQLGHIFESLKLVLDKISATRPVTGTADLDGHFTAQGASTFALKQSLMGNALFSFKQGRIKGFDLNHWLQYQALPHSEEVTRGIPFTRIDGYFKLNQGLLKMDRFTLTTPLLKIKILGWVDLLKKTLESTIEVALNSERFTIQLKGNFSKQHLNLEQSFRKNLARKMKHYLHDFDKHHRIKRFINQQLKQLQSFE